MQATIPPQPHKDLETPKLTKTRKRKPAGSGKNGKGQPTGKAKKKRKQEQREPEEGEPARYRDATAYHAGMPY
jgi:hypothetical protein